MEAYVLILLMLFMGIFTGLAMLIIGIESLVIEIKETTTRLRRVEVETGTIPVVD
jgi:hypothetical protein